MQVIISLISASFFLIARQHTKTGHNIGLHIFLTTQLYKFVSSYSAAAAAVSEQVRFHCKELTDVSHYMAWHACNSGCCSAAANRPLTAVVSWTQRIWGKASERQRVGHGVWFAAFRADLSTSAVRPFLKLSVLYRRSGTLARKAYPPVGSAYPSPMFNCFRWNQPVPIHDIPPQLNPSGSVFKKGFKQKQQLLPSAYTVANMYI